MERKLDELEREILIAQDEVKKLQVLIRVNNMLLSRFILQLQEVRKEFNIPKRLTLFTFQILDEDYQELCNEFTKEKTDKALFHLDRLLLKNKMQCPNNIKKYIKSKLKKKNIDNEKG